MKKIGKYLIKINIILGIISIIDSIALLIQYNCGTQLYFVMYPNHFLIVNIILGLTILLCLRIYNKTSNIIPVVLSTIIITIIIWRYLG